MTETIEGHLRVGTLEGVKYRPRSVTTEGGGAIVVFYYSGQVYAVDNRCPHSGYTLDTGSIDNGVLICAWHQARFVLSSGESLDPTIEDIHTYPVTVVEGEVWVKPVPHPKIEATGLPS